MTMRALIIAAVFVGVSGPALAETLYCSTSFQGYRICSAPGGATSTEWQWGGTVFGQDSDGERWSTSRWQDRAITTGTAPQPR